MAKLSPVKRVDLIRFFEHHGWRGKPGGKGSHFKITKPGMPRPVIIPYDKEIQPPVVLSNLKSAELARDDLFLWQRGNDQ